MLNLIKGALYGVAIGDALGAPLEFMTAAEIKNKHGLLREMVGGGCWNIKPGGITDDTEMTLCVAEGIAENPAEPIAGIGRRFIEWAKSGPIDIGITCKACIGEIMKETEKSPPDAKTWQKAARKTHQALNGRSGGNGALMRTIYPALFYPDLKTACAITAKQAQMTHWAKESTQACLIYTRVIHGLLTGGGKNHILKILANTRYQAAEYTNANPTGYVVDTMLCALKAIFTTNTFEEALIQAVNLGGDADTIGAVTGGIAGALYGYENIPKRWLAALDAEVSAALLRLSLTALDYRHEQKLREEVMNRKKVIYQFENSENLNLTISETYTGLELQCKIIFPSGKIHESVNNYYSPEQLLSRLLKKIEKLDTDFAETELPKLEKIFKADVISDVE